MKDFEIRCDESHLETNNIIYGKFTLGPFLPGQGTTFGNALRRSLLSELSGLSITAFEVIGVMQEFSTLPGLRESVLDLSLNLKQIVLTGILPCSAPPIGFLKIRGPAIIKAADLKLPVGIYCVSPEQYIGTVTSNGILNIKFLVSVGKGHSIQPYSLYRSLSKAKLQTTLSSNFLNNNNDDSEMNATWGLNSDQPSFVEQRSIGSRAQDLQTKSLFDNLSSRAELQANKIKQKPNFGVIASTARPQAKEEVNNFGSKMNAATNSNWHVESSMYREPNNKLESRKSWSSSGSKMNAAKKLNSFEYANIQTQIFQRINPHQVLPIDAVFTPVSQVNFLIQMNDRFETARENIVLEIWTDGSIHPKRALEEATLSLVQNFDALLKKIKHVSSFSKGLRYTLRISSDNSNNSTTQMEKNLPNKVSTVINTDSGACEIDTALSFQNRRRASEADPSELATFVRQKSEMNAGIPTSQRTLKTKNSNIAQKNNNQALIVKDQMPLHKAIYNLDIGNLDLSLQTFVLLKKAKISKLAHLLTNLSSTDGSMATLKANNLNEKIIHELKSAVNKFGLNL